MPEGAALSIQGVIVSCQPPNLSRKRLTLGLCHGAATWIKRLTGSFSYRGYRHLLVGSMLAQTVFQMNHVILGWQMLSLTHSAFWVGLVSFTSGVPLLIFSPFSGMLSDRYERHLIVLIGLAGSASAMLWLTWLSASGGVQPLHIVFAAFLLGLGFTLYAPARLAILPNVVPAEMLLSASTLEYSSTRLVGFVGPVLAGLLMEYGGIPISLVSGIVLLLFSAALFMRINGGRPSGNDPHGKDGVLIQLREALSYMRSDQPLWSLMLLGLVVVPIGMLHQKMLPIFVHDILGGGAGMLGLMVGLLGLGAAVVGIVLAGIGTVRQGRVLLGAALLIGPSVVLFALTRNPSHVLILAFLLGGIDGVYLTLSNTIFQVRGPSSMRGRLLGAWGMVWGLLPFTTLLAGFISDRVGAVSVIVGSGVLCFLITIYVTMVSARLREMV